ncbi:MAG: hypothetical protein Q9201_000247 [Fulgogasparrea decipioides]
MSAILYLERPRPRRAPSTTSSLAGMEKPFSSKETSPFEIYQDPIDLYLDQAQLNKPLPPTPRKPSSVYSMHSGEGGQSRQHRTRNDLLPSSVFLPPATYRSSTSRLPDPTPARPKLTREAQTHAVSDPIIVPRRDQEQQPRKTAQVPNLQQELRLDSLSLSASRCPSGKEPITGEPDSAEKHADVYMSVFPTRSPVVPASPSGQYFVDPRRTPSPMSGRITDVIDQSLIPAPLRFASFDESERPPSRFSSSSSESVNPHDGTRHSIRGMARKAFHFRKESKSSDDTDWAAFTRFQEKTSLTPRRQSRIGSFVDQRRASLQQSISGMYDTLASLTAPSKGPKPTPVTTNAPPKPHKPRIRSPAIPLSPYQAMGPKAWETASKASKASRKSTKSDKSRSEESSRPSLSKKERVQFSTPAHSAPLPQEEEPKPRSMVNKLTSALSSGTVQVESAVGLNTSRVKRTKSAKKRAELKKKIKVLGLGEPDADNARSQWL